MTLTKHIPNLITLGNLFCGTIATIYAVEGAFFQAGLFVVFGIFLDFFDASTNDPRRKQQGIYFSKAYQIGDKRINVIILDTRYFRSELTKDSAGQKRYIPNKHNEGTILGAAQWAWLEEVLSNSKANF